MTASLGCRMLVGSYGRPGQRDLDLGRALISYLHQLEWPDGVLVEDLSYSAPMVLHRLQEVLPGKVLLLGAVQRGADEPGTLRRYQVDVTPPRPEEVQQRLEESVQGMVDLDHTLAVARHWGGLPAETLVVEVEPADCSFGVGFSDEMAEVFDPIVAVVRELVGDLQAGPFDPVPQAANVEERPPSSTALAGLVAYAAKHEEARLLGGARSHEPFGLSGSLGLATASRCRPWSTGVGSGSDWCEVIPIDDRNLAVVAGDVPGRGADAVATMSELRAAVRAYAAVGGHSPARVMNHLDRLAAARRLEGTATLVYLTVNVDRADIRLTNAGHCPPLLLGAGRSAARFLREASSPPLGRCAGGARPEVAVRPGAESMLVVFSDGLVTSGSRLLPDGLEVLRRAARNGPDEIDSFCDHLLDTCLAGKRRDDDVSLLAVALPAGDRSPHRREHVPAAPVRHPF